MTPSVVVFASDVAPDFSELTSDGRAFDYMFTLTDSADRDAAFRALAGCCTATRTCPTAWPRVASCRCCR